MNRLEWLMSDHAKIGIELGIVRPDIFAKYIRYSIYRDHLKSHDKTTAIELTAEECKCHTDTIYKAIEFFTS